MVFEKYMDYELSTKYENESWDIVCSYTSKKDIIKACQEKSSSDHPVNGLSDNPLDICIRILEMMDDDMFDSDTCIILDNHFVLYAKKENQEIMFESFVNVIKIDSETCFSHTTDKQGHTEEPQHDGKGHTEEPQHDEQERTNEPTEVSLKIATQHDKQRRTKEHSKKSLKGETQRDEKRRTKEPSKKSLKGETQHDEKGDDNECTII